MTKMVGHRARVDAFDERRDARRVAQARAVIDVIRSETRPDELLEQVRLLVGAFRRSKTRERPRAVPVANLPESSGGRIERFVPRRLPEDVVPPVGIDGEIPVLRHARLPDERPPEPMPMMDVIETVTSLDAQTS
jgi:hypothetical protein